MLSERLRSIFRKDDPVSAGVHPAGVHQTGALLAALRPNNPTRSSIGSANLKSTGKESAQTRQSRGLEQFFFNIRDVVGLSVLDCAGASQDNIIS